MPHSLKLGLICVLLLSACGTTAAQVSVSGTPAKTAPSRVAGSASDDKDDLDTIHTLGRFVDAAENAYWTDVRDLAIPGITVLEADQPSVGQGTISLALMGDDDYGMAILSPSGTCIWYAFLGHQDRFGTGEPCTAVAAVSGSTLGMSPDSPWLLALDEVAPAQATAAQSALRNSLVAAKTYYSDAGTFLGISPEKLHEIEPALNFVNAGQPSTDEGTVSEAVVGDQFAAAALSTNGTCYWITERVGSRTQYGEGMPCTGTAALVASGSAWKAGG